MTSTTQQGRATPEQETTRTAWNAIADGYDTFVTAPGMPVAEDALRRAGLCSGMRVLDVAAGSGALSIPAARLGAHVVAADLSPRMIDRLEARARSEGLSTLEARVMDGHALELNDNTFDISASQFGVMLFPDLPRALRELVRVTKSGGRVVMVVYVAPTELDFLNFFIAAMHASIPGFTGIPTDPPPLPFQVADTEKLYRALIDAGLTDVRVENGRETLEFRSGKQMWDWVVNSNPLAQMLIGGLTSAQQEDVQQVLDGMLLERSGGNRPAILINPVYIGIGTK